MSTRQRLTRRNAAADKTPYPGTVNQPNRHDPEMDEYANWEQSINHELPDMRTEWKNDQRNEIGFGIPTVASIRSAASKAVKLAVLLLGDKVAENVIEAQARDFLRLGSKGLDSSLLRFAETQNVYAEDEKEEDKKDEPKAAVKAEDKKEDDKKDEMPKEAAKKACACGGTVAEDKKEDKKPDFLKDKEAKKAEDMKEEKKEDDKKASEVPAEQKSVPEGLKTDGTNLVSPKAASEKKADVPEALKENQFKKDDDKKDEPKASVKAEDMKEEKEEDKKASIKAMDDEMAEGDEGADEEKEASVKISGEQEVDMNPEGMEAGELTASEASELASIYADDEELDNEVKAAEEAKAKKASEKKGIKTLGGGAPKMASAPKGEVDLASIWDSAPDVSSVFE